MKHIDHFATLLRDTINLNQARIDTLEQRIETISDFLAGSDYDPHIRKFAPQGSWAHKTIIKPPGDKDFDADLVMIIDEIVNWTAKDYVEKLYSTFRSSDTYKEMVSRRTRCIQLNYAGDFHLDVVPVIQETGHAGTRYYVCNRNDDVCEATAPEDYTAWLRERNRITGGNQLRKVTRLLKYLRDIKGTFSCKSILMTTLLGELIQDADELYRDTHFSDLPTSLCTAVGRLDDYLQARDLMPRVQNPVLPEEDFNRHWDQQKYENFRNKIHQYREWIDDAYAEQDNDDSIAKWRRVFGDDFAKGMVINEGSKALAPMFEFAETWLAAIKEQGRQILSRFPTNWDHVAKPLWPVEDQFEISVQAGLSMYKNSQIDRQIASGDVVPTARWLRFSAHCPTGLPNSFKIWWRVVNTGGQAARRGDLRGGFKPSDGNIAGHKWEQTKYRGIHWVEAFVVNTRNDKCVGKSDRFFIVIE